MPAIAMALKSRREFVGEILKAAFGDGEPAAPPVSARKLTPKLFDAIFAGLK